MKLWIPIFMLLACSDLGRAIYGPSLTRTDTAIALRACEEANFSNGAAIAEALSSDDPAKIASVLGDAMEELRTTRIMSDLNAARRFCIHELVPVQLPREGEIASQQASQPTTLVKRFKDLGIEYFYYGPDAAWTLDDESCRLEYIGHSYARFPLGPSSIPDR